MSESDLLQALSYILDKIILEWKILFRVLARPPRYTENNPLKLALLYDTDGTYLFLPFRLSSVAW